VEFVLTPIKMRNATSSRHDIEGKQIMKKLAYFLMRYADSQGFRGIQIECAHDKVNWVWMNPPAPYKAELIAKFNSWDSLEDEEVDGKKTGKQIKTFGEVRQAFTKVYVELKPREGRNAENGGAAPVSSADNVGALG
jgi:hypothetical protein